MKPTPQQARAADPSKSVWVTANAGTGKTRVLSDRVLRLLLKGVNPQSILCLTFTRAAALEMITRIEDSLIEWAAEPDTDRLRQRLEDLCGQEVDEHTIIRARELFVTVQDLPNGLGVQTIHSFATQILKRFPLEAGLAPHFEIMDDRTAFDLMAESRFEILTNARLEHQELGWAIDHLAATVSDHSLSDVLQQLLNARLEINAIFKQAGGVQKLLQATASDMRIAPDANLRDIREDFAKLELTELEGLRKAAGILLHHSDKKTDQDLGTAITGWIGLDFQSRLDTATTYQSAFLTQKGEIKKRLITKTIEENYPAVANLLLREQARILQHKNQLNAVQNFSTTKALIHLASHLLETYEARKRRHAAIDYNDLIQKTSDLLESRAQRDWVLYKLDYQIDHLLIDEAQDTSPLQWNIVERLAAEFHHEEYRGNRTFFAVGDEKQSIYSFQGASLSHLHAVKNRIASSLPLMSEKLNRSFRSSLAILSVVDASLKAVANDEAFGGAITPHETTRTADYSEVCLWPLIPSVKEEKVGGSSWALPTEKVAFLSQKDQLTQKTTELVSDILGSQQPLASTGAKPKPGDILILLSKRTTIQESLIKAMKRAGIPVAGADQVNLKQHIAIKDFLALGDFLLLPDDSLSLACLLKSPLVGLSDDALMELGLSRGTKTLYEALRLRRHEPLFEPAAEKLNTWLKRTDFMPPYELFCSILKEGSRTAILERLGDEAIEPIETFLSQALVYEDGHPASLQGFLSWFRHTDSKVKRDPENTADEVRVMTVHSAKGLEAPVVILADAGESQDRRNAIILNRDEHRLIWKPAKHKDDSLSEKLKEYEEKAGAQEKLRLFYVALTRAKDCLHILGREKSKDKQNKISWHSLVEKAFDEIGDANVEKKKLDHGVLKIFKTGQPEPRKEQVKGQEQKTIVLPDWAQSVPITRIRQQEVFYPSKQGDNKDGLEVMEGFPHEKDHEGAGRLFGIEFHKIMDLLHHIPEPRRETMLTRLVHDPTVALSPDDKAELERQLCAVLRKPSLAFIFAAEALSEQPVMGRIAGKIYSGVIDRLIISSDEVHIVDFKTNYYVPSNVELVPDSYLHQLNIYHQLLEPLYGAHTIKASLLWTRTASLMQVPQEIYFSQA